QAVRIEHEGTPEPLADHAPPAGAPALLLQRSDEHHGRVALFRQLRERQRRIHARLDRRRHGDRLGWWGRRARRGTGRRTRAGLAARAATSRDQSNRESYPEPRHLLLLTPRRMRPGDFHVTHPQIVERLTEDAFLLAGQVVLSFFRQ